MTTLEDLLDRAEITNQVANYCRAVDRMDRELLLSVFHPDARIDLGARLPNGTVPEFVDFVWAAHGKLSGHSHQTTNALIRLFGDKAASEFCFTAGLWSENEGRIQEVFMRGRYVDRWARSGETWLITERWIAYDLRELREVSPLGERTGRRDRQDRSYAFLAGPL